MKKVMLSLLFAVVSMSAFAQFEKGTGYLNSSLSGLDMGYSNKKDFSLGAQMTAGYFLADQCMLLGQAGYSYSKEDKNRVTVGAAARYYLTSCGLYFNMGGKFEHTAEVNNFYLTPEIGYCFYLNHYVSLEPAIYYDASVNNFSDYSKVGVKLGVGFYF